VIPLGDVRVAILAQKLLDELPPWRLLLRRRTRHVRDDALRRLGAV
jgi:hypothetical protein